MFRKQHTAWLFLFLSLSSVAMVSRCSFILFHYNRVYSLQSLFKYEKKQRGYWEKTENKAKFCYTLNHCLWSFATRCPHRASFIAVYFFLDAKHSSHSKRPNTTALDLSWKRTHIHLRAHELGNKTMRARIEENHFAWFVSTHTHWVTRGRLRSLLSHIAGKMSIRTQKWMVNLGRRCDKSVRQNEKQHLSANKEFAFTLSSWSLIFIWHLFI